MHSLAALVALNSPFTFRSTTLSKVSSVYSVKGVLSDTPALLTRISMRPYFEAASRNALRTDSKLDRLGLIPATVASGYFSFSCATALSAEPCVYSITCFGGALHDKITFFQEGMIEKSCPYINKKSQSRSDLKCRLWFLFYRICTFSHLDDFGIINSAY